MHLFAQFYDGHGFSYNINFLSNGKIIETETDIFVNFRIVSLKSGGIIIAKYTIVDDGCDITGYLLDSNSNFNPTIHTSIPCFESIADIMDNNTALVIQDIKENYWTLLTVDFPFILNGRNHLLYILKLL